MIEFWKAGGAQFADPASMARHAEACGWDGQMFMDSQCLGYDPYVLMSAWVGATERLKVSPGVTNPLTRHPAVTAGAIASLQAISGGRAVLGIGRGDSALAYLGHAPAPLGVFRCALLNLQLLLAGGEIDFGAHALDEEAPSVDGLSLGEKPHGTRLTWLDPAVPKVSLDVAATGPKVIAMAGAIAEQVTFSVGAIPERLGWARGLAEQARADAGRADAICYGAQIIVVCVPDADAVREMATNFVAPLARFQVIQGEAAGPISNSDAAAFATIRQSYDMTEHGKLISHTKLGGATLDWDFVRRFAIVGPPDHCARRLIELAETGIERFVIVGPGFFDDRIDGGASLFEREVMPAVRSAHS